MVGFGGTLSAEFMYYVVNIHEIVNSLRVNFLGNEVNERREMKNELEVNKKTTTERERHETGASL